MYLLRLLLRLPSRERLLGKAGLAFGSVISIARGRHTLIESTGNIAACSDIPAMAPAAILVAQPCPTGRAS